jgi:hypothetical protein
MANLKTMRILPLFMILTIAGCAKENKTNCNYIKDYYQTIYLADYEFETEHYEKAFELYQDAFNSCEAKNTPTYNEIDKFTESAAILKKFDIAYEYAKKQVLKGVELTNFQNNASLDEFMTSKYGEKLVDEYEGLRKEFMKNAHLKLRDELIAMRTADQMHRGGYGKPDWPKQDSIDKLHEEMGDDVAFVMLSFDKDFETAKDFDKRKGYGLPIYAPGSNLPAMFQSSALPTTYIIDAKGNLALTHKGMADYSTPEFKEFLKSLK